LLFCKNTSKRMQTTKEEALEKIFNLVFLSQDEKAWLYLARSMRSFTNLTDDIPIHIARSQFEHLWENDKEFVSTCKAWVAGYSMGLMESIRSVGPSKGRAKVQTQRFSEEEAQLGYPRKVTLKGQAKKPIVHKSRRSNMHEVGLQEHVLNILSTESELAIPDIVERVCVFRETNYAGIMTTSKVLKKKGLVKSKKRGRATLWSLTSKGDKVDTSSAKKASNYSSGSPKTSSHVVSRKKATLLKEDIKKVLKATPGSMSIPQILEQIGKPSSDPAKDYRSAYKATLRLKDAGVLKSHTEKEKGSKAKTVKWEFI